MPALRAAKIRGVCVELVDGGSFFLVESFGAVKRMLYRKYKCMIVRHFTDFCLEKQFRLELDGQES